MVFFLMIRRPPRSTRTDTLFPYPTLFRSLDAIRAHVGDGVDVRGALAALEADYAGRGIELVRRGERWHFRTAGDMAHVLRRDREEARKLSRAGIETLAIIAYHEPVTRAEIESIRGVQISKGKRSEENTTELQSLQRISFTAYCWE